MTQQAEGQCDYAELIPDDVYVYDDPDRNVSVLACYLYHIGYWISECNLVLLFIFFYHFYHYQNKSWYKPIVALYILSLYLQTFTCFI